MGMGPTDNPDIEFTQADFDTYMARIEPYSMRIDEGCVLSEQEVKYLKDTRMELWKRFTPTSLSQYSIVGHINSALSIDDIRKAHKWETELDKKHKHLEFRLDEGRADGTLSKQEEKELSRRRDKICYALDPTHYHGSPPQ